MPLSSIQPYPILLKNYSAPYFHHFLLAVLGYFYIGSNCMCKLVLFCLISLSFLPAFAQVKTTVPVKVTAPPKIDGILDEAVWNDVPIATDFITQSPEFGKPATAKN